MKLSELKSMGFDCTVLQDSEFNLLGMISTKYSNEKVLSFLTDKKYLQILKNNVNIVAIICDQELLNKVSLPPDMGVILSSNPQMDFYCIHNLLVDRRFYWKQFSNEISGTANISEHAIISNHSIKIGHNSLIEPAVVIFPGSIIGDDVIVRSGSQIGTNGFQFVNNGDSVLSVKTGGRVIIKDRVEIQHNCCIDRGVLGGDTILENDVKLDNFIHIAHDDHIGERTFITAGVKIAGRVTVGKDCWLGVNATISNGVVIGDNSRISLGSVVTKDVGANSTVTGNFAIDHRRFIEFIKSIR